MSNAAELCNLQHTVHINESMKRVLELARQINIVAINALLVSQHARKNAAGFRVVAIELRTFSQKIDDLMATLREMIFQLVGKTARVLKLTTRLRLLQATLARMESPSPELETRTRQIQADYQTTLKSGIEEWWQLASKVERSLVLCRSGKVLSHNGRIEASYGDASLPQLGQIAFDIDVVVNQAIEKLQDLHYLLSDLQ